MKTNVGNFDRMVRIISGVMLMALALISSRFTWAWISVIPLLTGILSYCPIWAAFGIDTRNYDTYEVGGT